MCGRDSVCSSGSPAKERAKWNKTWRVTARSIQTVAACPHAFEHAIMECAAERIPSFVVGRKREKGKGQRCLAKKVAL